MSHLAEKAAFITTSESLKSLPVISKERADDCYRFFLDCIEKNERVEKEGAFSR